MGEVPSNRARSNNGDLDSNIIEGSWLHSGESGHLGAAFDLEDSDGIGPFHHVERGPIIDGNANEIDRAILSSLLASGEAVLDGCHHTEAKEVDLDDS